MNTRLAILSALLRYPDDTLRGDLPDIAAAIATAGFAERDRRALERLVRRLGTGDALDRQEDFVRLFDRGRSTSLHLFEHVHQRMWRGQRFKTGDNMETLGEGESLQVLPISEACVQPQVEL